MTFTCDCSIDVEENATACFAEWRRARKPHVCCECGEVIPPGARYEHVRGLWHGRWATYATCAPCAGIRHDYCPHSWAYGGLREAIYDCLGFDYVSGEEQP